MMTTVPADFGRREESVAFARGVSCARRCVLARPGASCARRCVLARPGAPGRANGRRRTAAPVQTFWIRSAFARRPFTRFSSSGFACLVAGRAACCHACPSRSNSARRNLPVWLAS
jgi:hypothetical protein